MKLTAQEIESRNFSELNIHLIEKGNKRFRLYKPIIDDGIDLILDNRKTGKLERLQLKARWTILNKYVGRNIS